MSGERVSTETATRTGADAAIALPTRRRTAVAADAALEPRHQALALSVGRVEEMSCRLGGDARGSHGGV